ncbi:uncharacterized protein [Physcomitrium patens]|uniref:BHLH domain-containing protein n=2 Tax=Physcomitrium patens TaxID=3218 RepID=A0A2K1KTQ2_PHYPA|nr:hypothetical protein PHYPA_004142 [Physcomitrium patens]
MGNYQKLSADSASPSAYETISASMHPPKVSSCEGMVWLEGWVSQASTNGEGSSSSTSAFKLPEVVPTLPNTRLSFQDSGLLSNHWIPSFNTFSQHIPDIAAETLSLEFMQERLETLPEASFEELCMQHNSKPLYLNSIPSPVPNNHPHFDKSRREDFLHYAKTYAPFHAWQGLRVDRSPSSPLAFHDTLTNSSGDEDTDGAQLRSTWLGKTSSTTIQLLRASASENAWNNGQIKYNNSQKLAKTDLLSNSNYSLSVVSNQSHGNQSEILGSNRKGKAISRSEDFAFVRGHEPTASSHYEKCMDPNGSFLPMSPIAQVLKYATAGPSFVSNSQLQQSKTNFSNETNSTRGLTGNDLDLNFVQKAQERLLAFQPASTASGYSARVEQSRKNSYRFAMDRSSMSPSRRPNILGNQEAGLAWSPYDTTQSRTTKSKLQCRHLLGTPSQAMDIIAVGPALNTNGRPRAKRGSATDPQSVYARHRREKINERLKTLQRLVPNGEQVDIVTMLEEAIHFVKFLEFQLELLRSDDRWMFADPFIYNGMDITGSYPHVPSGLERLNLRG